MSDRNWKSIVKQLGIILKLLRFFQLFLPINMEKAI